MPITLQQAGDLDGAIRRIRIPRRRARFRAGAFEFGRRAGPRAPLRRGQSRNTTALFARARTTLPSAECGSRLLQNGPPRRSRRPLRAGRLSRLSVQRAGHPLLASCYNNLARYKESCDPAARSRKARPAIRRSTISMEPLSSAMPGAAAQPSFIAFSAGRFGRSPSAAGTLELSAHNRDGALVDLEKAVALNPAYPGSCSFWANCCLPMESPNARAPSSPRNSPWIPRIHLQPNMGVLQAGPGLPEARRYFDLALRRALTIRGPVSIGECRSGHRANPSRLASAGSFDRESPDSRKRTLLWDRLLPVNRSADAIANAPSPRTHDQRDPPRRDQPR